MTGGISFSGLASGLDSGAIIDALLQAERIPIGFMEDRRAAEQNKINLIGTFRGLVSSLQSAAESIGTTGGFLSFSADVNIPGYVSASADETAVSGSHTFQGQVMATSDRWVFDSVADPDAALGTVDGQAVSFDYDGTSYSFPLQAGTSSLNDVAAAINAGTDGNVTASVVNSGTAASPSYELVLAGAETGDPYRITNITSTLPGLTIDPTLGGPNNLTVAGNAFATVDGILVERTSNDFSDVLTGVSMTLLDADPNGPTVTINVGPDKAAIRSGIQSFVDAYNGVVGFINEQSEVNEDGEAQGALIGDSILATVQRTLRSSLFNTQPNSDPLNPDRGFESLNLIGIEIQSDGRLQIDSAKLDAKLDEDVNAVADLFADSDGFDNGGALPGDPLQFTDTTADTGLADDLARALDLVLKDQPGPNSTRFTSFFNARTQTLNDSISRINDRIETEEGRLETYEQFLVSRFTALETLLGQLNAQQSFLNQQIGGLQG